MVRIRCSGSSRRDCGPSCLCTMLHSFVSEQITEEPFQRPRSPGGLDPSGTCAHMRLTSALHVFLLCELFVLILLCAYSVLRVLGMLSSGSLSAARNEPL